MKRKLNHIKYKASDGLKHCKAYVLIETIIYRKELLINTKSKIYIKDSLKQNYLDEIKDWMIFNNPSNFDDFYRIIKDDKILIKRLRNYLISSKYYGTRG